MMRRIQSSGMSLVGRPDAMCALGNCTGLVIAGTRHTIGTATVEGLDVPEEHTLRLRRPSDCMTPRRDVWHRSRECQVRNHTRSATWREQDGRRDESLEDVARLPLHTDANLMSKIEQEVTHGIVADVEDCIPHDCSIQLKAMCIQVTHRR